MPLKIGELAKRIGLTVRTLHHYDRIGLLCPSARAGNGFRLYSWADVIRLHRIQALKQLGCPLADIRALLDAQMPPAEIIARQIRVLDEQVRCARILKERLVRLGERIARGGATGIDDWLGLLETMNMHEKHFAADELASLRAHLNNAERDFDDEWRQLIRAVRAAIGQGLPFDDAEAQALGWRWMRLLKDSTGNDVGLAVRLTELQHKEVRIQEINGITPEVIDWLARAFACARASLFAGYLSPAEAEQVKRRLLAHVFDWIPLVAEARQRFVAGSDAGDPAVLALARRWEALFRASYCGDDPVLEEKVHLAFRNEPDLLLGVGLDSALIAFVQMAIEHLHHPGNERDNDAGIAPKPSALLVATLRAAHQLLDSPPLFADPLALPILGPAAEGALRADPRRYDTPLLRALRTSLAVRSRLAEEEWQACEKRAVSQCVLLGAGLDTSAYRDREVRSARFFEVDLPSMQQWKRACLRAAGIAEPECLRYVAVDFARDSLGDSLRHAGFRQDAAAFFSWLGVTVYLDEADILETLRFIASCAKGSCVVFDYAVLPALLTPDERSGREFLASRSGTDAEPWRSGFDPAELADRLRRLGFAEVKDFGTRQLHARYLGQREDGQRMGGVTRLMRAAV